MSDEYGVVKVKLSGSEYRLRFDFPFLADLEEEYDKNVTELMDLWQEGKFGMRDLRKILWIAARNEYGDDVTIRTVGKWVGPGDLQPLTEAILEAMNTAFGGPKNAGSGTEEVPGETENPSTGERLENSPSAR